MRKCFGVVNVSKSSWHLQLYCEPQRGEPNLLPSKSVPIDISEEWMLLHLDQKFWFKLFPDLERPRGLNSNKFQSLNCNQRNKITSDAPAAPSL